MPTLILDGSALNVDHLTCDPNLLKGCVDELSFCIKGRGPRIPPQRAIPITFSCDGALRTGVFRLIGCKTSPEVSDYRFARI